MQDHQTYIRTTQSRTDSIFKNAKLQNAEFFLLTPSLQYHRIMFTRLFECLEGRSIHNLSLNRLGQKESLQPHNLPAVG